MKINLRKQNSFVYDLDFYRLVNIKVTFNSKGSESLYSKQASHTAQDFSEKEIS